ncbi:hypothetical protein EW145_g4283 [Phellinidium pouzarii]|uniref:Uncharacterized protein n=1 Tax=Phellinidium pouzarii TaxID=167371 RepID=A0A4S4L498_9AGAM|nr:hypothetical protein EW145_g4283 [Phellinidium pouzarii]
MLENAISRLGGIRDVLYSIQRFRASFALVLRWDQYGLSESNIRSVFYKDRVLDPTEVLERSWLDLEEDGTMFRGPRSSDVRFQMDLISGSIGAMYHAFDELGTVNGCQFVSLYSILWVIYYNALNKIRGQRMPHDNTERKEKELAIEHLFGEIPKDMCMLSEEVTKAINTDISNLQIAEQRLTGKYTSMTTAATFFSSITVTAMQISSTMTGDALKDAVNTVWFTSLVFSIGSVIISLVGLSWFQSPMCSNAGDRGKGIEERSNIHAAKWAISVDDSCGSDIHAWPCTIRKLLQPG